MAIEQAVTGLRDLEKKLVALGTAVGGKILRQATMNATSPTTKRMKAAAPIGKRAHRTYTGRLVAPGFLKQSVTRKSWYRAGRVTVKIGVRKEAFYGVSFTDFRRSGQRRQPWFKHIFINDRKSLETRFANELRKKILKAASGGR